jgi:hypothetical protein
MTIAQQRIAALEAQNARLLRAALGASIQIARLRKRVKSLKAAVRIFPAAYPDSWERMLHEEGCVGTQSPKSERYEDECRCDGDYDAALVKRAIR